MDEDRASSDVGLPRQTRGLNHGPPNGETQPQSIRGQSKPILRCPEKRYLTRTQFIDGEIQTFPTVTLEKTLALTDGVAATDVAAIHGEIEYLLPTRVHNERVDVPLEGKVVERDEVRIQFQPGSDRSIAYQASGDTRRLLSIRGLNQNRQLLESGSAMWGENWFGSGEHVSIDINGRIAAAEVVLAEQFEPVIYSFELPGALPPMGGDNPRKNPPVTRATPNGLATALHEAPPEVVFEYTQPEATQVAGPALLAVKSLQASPLMGLVAQLELFVADSVPLAGQLNGSSIILDRGEFANGDGVFLDLSGPVSLSNASGYWLNGEYKTDPDEPWLKGRLMLQDAEYDGSRPVTLDGRIVFRAAGDLVTETAPVAPGTRLAVAGTEVVVDQWREDSITLQIPMGAEQLVSVEILGADDAVVGRADRIDGTGADSTASVNVYSPPQTLQVTIATQSDETEVPFSVDLTR
jgi:hypothetical protein